MARSDQMFDDEDYPAYTMGRAAEIIGVSQDFLRRIGDLKPITPLEDQLEEALRHHQNHPHD